MHPKGRVVDVPWGLSKGRMEVAWKSRELVP